MSSSVDPFLVFVIVVITLVAAIALLMNTESALETNIAGSELDAQQARYLAQGGVNHALWKVRQQGCGPYGDLLDEPLGNDKYTTTLTTGLGSTTAFTISVLHEVDDSAKKVDKLHLHETIMEMIAAADWPATTSIPDVFVKILQW